MKVSGDTSMGGPAGRFPTTKWSQVVRLKNPDADEFLQAVNDLARDYWKPVYAYIRASWGKNNEEAKDLTQEFFSFLMQKNAFKRVTKHQGKFRLLLLTVLKHFLVDEHRRESRIKRGGSSKLISMDDDALPVMDVSATTPEEAFDRAWARTLLARALGELQKRLNERNRAHQFKAFQLRYIDMFLKDTVEGDRALESMAKEAGRSLTEFKNDLVAARTEFRELVLDHLRESVENERETQEELQYLLGLV